MKWIQLIPFLLLLNPNLLFGQISVAISAGPENDLRGPLELCIRMTNIFPNEINLLGGEQQIIRIQFGDAPLNGSATELPSCMDPRDISIINSTIAGQVNPDSLSLIGTDENHLQINFEFTNDMRFASDQSLTLLCFENTNLSELCDSLVYLVDCTGNEFTVFNNGTFQLFGIEDCTEGFAQQCDVSTDSLEVICGETDNDFITFEWEEEPSASSYEVNINNEGWQNIGNQQELTIQNLDQNQMVDFQVRALGNCRPFRTGSAQCTAFKFTIENSVFIPNVFSPNGDNRNDRFTISGIRGITIEQLSIYDIWGNLIFQRNNLPINDSGLSFDGQWKNTPLKPQLLIYHSVFILPDGSKEQKTGDITLIR